MTLSIPLDFPGHSFDSQLERLERWACLVPGTLLNSRNELYDAWSDGTIESAFLKCVGSNPWSWPAYDEYIADGGFQFSDDLARDMAEQIYEKFRSSRNGLYRKSQLDGMNEFRPFWQLVGECAGNAKITLPADDEYWKTGCVPWNCSKLGCGCRVDSLTRREYEQLNPEVKP